MRADLHVHTHHSGDNHQEVEEIFQAMKDKGLSAVAITDHNSLKGAIEAMEKAPRGIIVLPGIEVTSDDGHILALNVNSEIPRGLSAEETIAKIHQAGGIAVAAHPYRMWSGLKTSVIRSTRFDAIEATNGRNTRRNNRRGARLAKELDLPVIAGSDAHHPQNVGAAYCILPDDARTPEDIIEAIMGRKLSLSGEGRNRKEAVSYATRSVFRWMRRGMRRL